MRPVVALLFFAGLACLGSSALGVDELVVERVDGDSEEYIVRNAGNATAAVIANGVDLAAKIASLHTGLAGLRTRQTEQGSQVAVIGGLNAALQPLGSVVAFDPLVGWGAIAGTLSAKRARFAAAFFNGGIYVSGGSTATEAITTTVEVVFAKKRWAAAAPLLSARARHGSAVFMGELYVVGGQNRADTEVFDGKAWRMSASMGQMRASAGVSVLGDHLYAVGGQGANAFLASAERFDGAVWANIAPMQGPRGAAPAVALGSLLYIIGGSNGTVSNMSSTAVWNGATWSQGPPLRAGRSSAAAVAFRGSLYIFGGVVQANATDRVVATERLDDKNSVWVTEPTLQLPDLRFHMAAVVLDGS